MFYKLAAANSKRDRKDNSLYFGSMIISIIAFYIILSLSDQDVMVFLKRMESDAVNRLFAVIPFFYLATLVVLFLLVYFVNSIQMEERKREFGIYLTLGMKRRNLFGLLLLEDFRSSINALIIGLPVAVMLSECISLVTSKLAGLGIVGHRFSISLEAVVYTVLGFLAVKLFTFIFLCIKIYKKDIGDLLNYSPMGIKKQLPKVVYIIAVVIGIFMLIKAYRVGINGGITVLLGVAGTILLFFGLRVVIGAIAGFKSKKRLHTYNFRQIQELIIYRSTMLAICSLLIFSALCLFGAGIAISTDETKHSAHLLDYTFREKDSENAGSLNQSRIKQMLQTAHADRYFSEILAVQTGTPSKLQSVSFRNLIRHLQGTESDAGFDSVIDNWKNEQDCYLISLSSYNHLRRAANKAPLVLKKGQAAFYMGEGFASEKSVIDAALAQQPEISIMGDRLRLTGTLESLPLVTDRSIQISTALIVPDTMFQSYTKGKISTYVSGILKPEIVKEKGQMKAILDINKELDRIGIRYKSYIQNMGRQLFFTVSASYITIYLASMFLIVANAMIGVQFLMGQRKSYKRYQTLIRLGATYSSLCKASGKQINWHFGLPVLVAFVNSIFGVQILLDGIVPFSLRKGIGHWQVAAGVIGLLVVFELIYLYVVKKQSNRYIRTLMELKRED